MKNISQCCVNSVLLPAQTCTLKKESPIPRSRPKSHQTKCIGEIIPEYDENTVLTDKSILIPQEMSTIYKI